MLFGIFGCAAQPVATSGATSQAALTQPTAQMAWVASPSAKLPKAFPPPGPLGQVMVKEYPAYREAVVQAGGDHKNANGMFYPLFNHIQRNGVAMSAPVEMRYQIPHVQEQTKVEPVSMAFVYPEPTTGKAGSDGSVSVVDVPAMTVVSVAVRGSYSAKHFQAGYARLAEWMQGHKDEYEVSGSPRYLAYNSPFVLPMFRLGEVQIPVRRRER